MESLVKADIFFFVTTIVVIVWGIIGIIIGVLIIKILRNIRDVSDTTKREVTHLMHDISEVRQDVKAGIQATSRYTKMAAQTVGVRQILGFLINQIMNAGAGNVSDDGAPKRRRARKRSSGIRRRKLSIDDENY